MESGAAIRGKLKGRHIELEEPVDDLEGDVEVFVRAVRESTPRAPDVLEVIVAMPPGNRDKGEIDAELAHDRAAGMAAPDIYLDACCFIYLVEGTPEWRGAVESRLRLVPQTAQLITSQLS